MKMRWFAVAMSVFAMAAGLSSAAWLGSSTAHTPRLRSYHPVDLPVAGQLPQGFTLPSADVNLSVSSLITADLDADGDLDIVAADRSDGGIGIVVWVNDGAGRLTRKAPSSKGTLASEPASPSLDEHDATVMATVQPDGPALATISVDSWFTLPAQPYSLARLSVPESVTPATLRSRSPPALS